tara:strand:- start:3535 stop:3921 length:387 start_codon:yes stop_codon:yes gene_type:complete
MGKELTSSIKRLLSKSMSKTTRKQLMKIAKQHDKSETKKKKKKKQKKQKKKSRTHMKRGVSREGIDFKTFHIDFTKPSSCMTKRKCKSHRMNIPKRRNGCKSKGEIMMNHMKTPKKKCNESLVHFLNL